jgi:hypothetical protein
MMADRRLTIGNRIIRDDAVKLMSLETSDGRAFLGYAGLGSTHSKTQPSDWMSNVLRGRGLTMERSLGILLDAMRQRFFPFIREMAAQQQSQHNVVVPAVVQGTPRLYSLDLVLSEPDRFYGYRYSKWETEHKPGVFCPPTIAYGGSGAAQFENMKDTKRHIRHLVRANERGLISPHAVSEYLADVNYRISELNSSVGPNSIIAWNYSRGWTKFNGGRASYTGKERDLNMPEIPMIAGTLDMRAFGSALLKKMNQNFLDKGFDGALSNFADIVGEELPKAALPPNDALK